MNRNSFLHISDLHFFRPTNTKSCKEEISQFEIKKRILSYISSLIKDKQIGAILISGDLELDSAEDITPFITECLHADSKVFIVFGEHDTREKREELILKTKNLRGLYIIDEPEIINDDSLSFCVYGMSCESKQSGFTQKYQALDIYNQKKPAIFLTHPCSITKDKVREIGCQYYAVGHIHKYFKEKIDDNIYLGRPGHLYSIWDGDGKAWPVGGIIGNFIEDRVQLNWLPFPVPQTIRIYIDRLKLKDNKSMLVIENCSPDKAKRVKKIIMGEWEDQNYRGVFTGYIDGEKDDIYHIIERLSRIFINDIFVTPSDSGKMKKKYGYNRIAVSAETLLKDKMLFHEYVERIYKASEKTQ